jgi:hypothetical protein
MAVGFCMSGANTSDRLSIPDRTEYVGRMRRGTCPVWSPRKISYCAPNGSIFGGVRWSISPNRFVQGGLHTIKKPSIYEQGRWRHISWATTRHVFLKRH